MFSAERKLISMSIDIDVLRSLYRLSRKSGVAPLTFEKLAAKTFADEASIRKALFSLASQGLIQRTPAGLRLTLPGLAIAVACAGVPRSLPRARTFKPRVSSAARRHRAA